MSFKQSVFFRCLESVSHCNLVRWNVVSICICGYSNSPPGSVCRNKQVGILSLCDDDGHVTVVAVHVVVAVHSHVLTCTLQNHLLWSDLVDCLFIHKHHPPPCPPDHKYLNASCTGSCRNYKAMQRSGWLMDWDVSGDLEVSYILCILLGIDGTTVEIGE